MEKNFKKSIYPVAEIRSVQFGIFSPDQILTQSVTQAGIVGPNNKYIGPGINDPDTKTPGFRKLTDQRLGSLDDLDDPGSFGHVTLAMPIYHIGFINQLVHILGLIGYYSHKVIKTESIDIHDPLKRAQPTYQLDKLNIFIIFQKKRRIFKPYEALSILKDLSDSDIVELGMNPIYSRPADMIVQVVPIPPPHVRPAKNLSENAKDDDDITKMYSLLIMANNTLTASMKKGESVNKTDSYLEAVQNQFANIIDNENSFTAHSASLKENKPLHGFNQRLSSKEGQIRGNLMGKRVDYTARSVITAEPNLSFDQLGVPLRIAMNLTFPEIVNSTNIVRLTRLVQNGPKIYPGVRYIISSGLKLDLSVAALSTVRLKIGDIVERHLLDDDYVIFNRQPTLHKMSMMGFKVKVLPGLTFRLNLSVTTPFNADFDGDEMNMHVPQSIEAAAEVAIMMMTNEVVVSAQNNRPVMGIVQDTLLSSFLLTKDTYLTKEQMVSAMLSINQLPLPEIDDIPLWTGKQLIEMAIPPQINYNGNGGLVIRNGKILSGTLDKSSLGPTSNSLIHVIYNDLGPEVTKNFINNIQRITQSWSFGHSFSIGIYDIVSTKEMSEYTHNAIDIAKENVAILSKKWSNGELRAVLDQTVDDVYEDTAMDILTQVKENIGKQLAKTVGLDNGIKCTISADSKGSINNLTQVMQCVGQQNVDGKRIRYGFNNRTLPHYPPFDESAEARGFVTSSYCKGLNPQEFFFHAMGGRVGAIDTATQTANTGYIQRKLVKALEDISIRYDNTVRNSSNEIIQLRYAYDSIDGSKLEAQTIPIVTMSIDGMKNRYGTGIEYDMLILLRTILRNIVSKTRGLHDLNKLVFYVPVNIERIILNHKMSFNINSWDISDLKQNEIINKVNNLLNELSTAVPEKYRLLFDTNIRCHLASKVVQEHGLSRAAFDSIIDTVKEQYFKSMIEPGEMCGVVAAQSIGEPATQMTLSSFHSIGTVMKGLTQGVPRLRELLDVSKTPKTPLYTIYLDQEHRASPELANKVLRSIKCLKLEQLITSSSGGGSGDELVLFIDPKIMIEEDIALVLIKEAILDKYSDAVDYVYKDITHPKEYLTVECSLDDISNPSVKISLNRTVGVKDSDVMEIIMRSIGSIVLRGISEITKAFIKRIDNPEWDFENTTINKPEWIIVALGRNFKKLLNVDGIDTTRTTVNDVRQVKEVFGIEAAQKVLYTEMRNSINLTKYLVNFRHVLLLSEVMCFTGDIFPVTRFGVTALSPSPLMRASFEKTSEILLSAAVHAEKDNLIAVSENIMFGKLAPVGTGLVNFHSV